MKIYNTFTRKKEEFKSIVENKVGIYVCGPTVYGMPHLGHAKSYINFDTIIRFFKFSGYKVKYVQNITDVGHLVGDSDDGEDKILRQAKAENIDAYEVAYKYETEFFNAMDKLNVLRPSISCRATGFIPEMIDAVKSIVDKGYGYVTEQGNVYFDVRKYTKYGQLSNRKLDQNISGERIAVATDKRNPEDFALWKTVDENTLMQWPSPWGNGCPGWHIECTVLSRKFLGEQFDIHGGGIDNIFPHHECECAQADVLNGHMPMNFFMHNGLVTVNGTKMGKSLGNFITLQDLVKKYDPMVIRYFIQQFHYRSNVDFNEDSLEIANKQFNKLKEVVNAVRLVTTDTESNMTNLDLKTAYDNFVDAMNEDFNTPLAMVELNKIVKISGVALESKDISLLKQINYFVEKLAEDVIGLEFGTPVKPEEQEIPAEVKQLADKRWLAKQNKNWAEADALRDQVKSMGYVIVDRKDGFDLEKL